MDELFSAIRRYKSLYARFYHAHRAFLRKLFEPFDSSHDKTVIESLNIMGELHEAAWKQGEVWRRELDERCAFLRRPRSKVYNQMDVANITDFKARLGVIQYIPKGDKPHSIIEVYDIGEPAPLDLLRYTAWGWADHPDDEKMRLTEAVAGWAASRIRWRWGRDMDDLIPEVMFLLTKIEPPPLLVLQAQTEADVERQEQLLQQQWACWCQLYSYYFFLLLTKRLDREAYRRRRDKARFPGEDEIDVDSLAEDAASLSKFFRGVRFDPVEQVEARLQTQRISEICSSDQFEALVMLGDGHSREATAAATGLSLNDLKALQARLNYQLDQSQSKKKKDSYRFRQQSKKI